ncbi:MAG: SPOR domain-containing protein [Glaciecola sp.]|jgi:cell division protein FtsN|nr:SPOR domain-containing protein [Glaciecola sp.]HAQ48603.1 cell division protein FtsN [Glaciecola sp.]HCF78436.1 cell division protein FtsN [Glaciecola sp.]
MAQKDYIKRKPTPRKKGTPSNRSKASAKSATSSISPKIKIGFAVLVLAGFAYFLYSIKDDATVVPATAPSVKIVTQPDIDELDPLPELPKEEWAFIKSLPGYEVEIEAEVATSDKRYLMQCGSFKIYEQADSMRATMAFVGLEPQIRGSKSGWYRVILGPYDSKRDAERDRHVLQRENINSCQIWFWNL